MAKSNAPLGGSSRPFGNTPRPRTPSQGLPETHTHPKTTPRPPIGPAKAIPRLAPPPAKLPSKFGGPGK